MSDKMLTNKCNYLESLIKITMECVIAAKAEGVDITEGKDVDIDLALGKNGFNIPEKDQVGRSDEEFKAWKLEIKTHLVSLAIDELRPPNVIGNLMTLPRHIIWNLNRRRRLQLPERKLDELRKDELEKLKKRS
jgi:hypothetical protein